MNPLRCACVAGPMLLAPAATAQTLDDIREDFRRGLQDAHFAKGFVGLVLASDEVELGGSVLFLDDDQDTEITSFSFPFQRTFSVAKSGPRVYTEGAIGYSRANQRVDDLYDGADPMLVTSIDTDWTTFGGLAGAGIEFDAHDEVKLAPIVNIGVARLENNTDYAGPGAVTEAIADGIAFNWDAVAISYGAALRAEWEHDLTDEHELTVVGRYDARWTETISSDDDAQDFSTRSQLVTLRADVVGPTGLRLFESDVRWRTTIGGRHFIEGDLFGVENYVELGGGFDMPGFPPGGTVSIDSAIILGENMIGYSFGIGLSF